MTSFDIKFSLLWYFRFRRQWLCATECHMWDVVAINDKYIIEVEVKVSKSDLWHGEARKEKHNHYRTKIWPSHMPNKFYVCVPESLMEEAKKWVEATNKDYGIIIYRGHYDVVVRRTAKLLKDGYDESLKDDMLKRVCTENIMMMRSRLKQEVSS